VVKVTREPLPEVGRECGIDLGLKHFVVMDNGTKIPAPRYQRRAEKKLKRAQKDLARNNREAGPERRLASGTREHRPRLPMRAETFTTSSPPRSSA
jgi:hypothetical protein